MKCGASMVSNTMTDFGGSESTLALTLDLKSAFKSVLPGSLINELRSLRVLVTLPNLVSFLVSKRNVYFSSDGGSLRAHGVGIPQGRILSPLLLKLTLRAKIAHLQARVTMEMYADGLFLYVTIDSISKACYLLKLTDEWLSPWLATLGISISILKSQLYFFSRDKIVTQDISVTPSGTKV